MLKYDGSTHGLAFYPQPDPATFQISYLANNSFHPARRLCVNVYTFDPAEELISCHARRVGSLAFGYQQTETPFSAAELSPTELTRLTSRAGALGAGSK